MSNKGFDFTSLLESISKDYIRREKVEARISEFIDNQQYGFCLITGEPGSGKTVLAASNIRANKYLHYFLRKGHSQFSLWSDPYAFLTTIGYQLWERFGDNIFPSTVGIDINGRVRNVLEGGSVVGAEIERLVPLPWHSARINVQLKANKIKGETIGLRIKEVIEDYRFLPIETFREIAFFDPIRKLAKQKPDEKVILWIDGLDEEYESFTKNESSTTITSLLPTFEEIYELGNVIIIASSRPGHHIDSLRNSKTLLIDLGETSLLEENKKTISDVIDIEFNDLTVKSELDKAEWDITELRNDLVSKANDNFLYVKYFFLEIKKGEIESLKEKDLPESLDELYSQIFSRLVRIAGQNYFSEMHPIIALLAVAMEPLHIDQISKLAGLARNNVKLTIEKIRPFLEESEITVSNSTKRKCYTFFHKTFRDVLCETKYIDESWYVDLQNAHGNVADKYLTSDDINWNNLDDYGLDFLTHHLQKANNKYRRRLVEMINERWRAKRRGVNHSNRTFLDDLKRAYFCLDSLDTYEIIPQASKLSHVSARIQWANSEIPYELINVMAQLGLNNRAMEYLVPDNTPKYISKMAEMIKGLSALSTPDYDLIHQMRSIVLNTKQNNPNHADLSILLEACPAFADNDSKTFLENAIQQYNKAQVYWASPPALIHIGRLFSAFDISQAIGTFDQCLDLIPKVSTSAMNIYYSQLFEVWSSIDANDAYNAAIKIQWQLDSYAIKTLLNTSLKADFPEKDKYIYEVIAQIDEATVSSINNPYAFAMAEIKKGEVEHAIGNNEAARSRINRAMEAAENIGGEGDPDNNLQNRLEMAAEVWITIAELAINSEHIKSVKLLERAWKEALNHGIYNEEDGIRKLVQIQYKRSPDLLEARLENFSDKELQIKYYVFVGELMLIHDNQKAKYYVDKAMSLLENATPHLANQEYFLLTSAVALGREKGLRLLEKSGLNRFELDFNILLYNSTNLKEKKDINWIKKIGWLWRQSLNNFTLEQTVLFANLPIEIFYDILEETERDNKTAHKLFLEGILSAKVAETDLSKGTELLDNLCLAAGEVLKNHNRIRLSEIHAFFAGAWWNVNREIANELWGKSLIYATSLREEMQGQLSFEIKLAIEALSILAPEAALPPLLGFIEPESDPNTIGFTIAGPTTQPLIGAGLLKTDILFCELLATKMANLSEARIRFESINDPALTSLTASIAAKQNNECDLEERMNWCNTAFSNAESIPQHYLKCLLLAITAESFHEVGIKSRAKQIAENTAKDIFNNGYAFNSLFCETSYAHALGKCLTILSDYIELKELTSYVWNAQILQSGLAIFLSYLPGLFTEDKREKSVNLFRRGNIEVQNLFTSE